MLLSLEFKFFVLCGRYARTIEVLSAYIKCVHVEDRYQHFYGMGGLTMQHKDLYL